MLAHAHMQHIHERCIFIISFPVFCVHLISPALTEELSA